MTSVVWFRNDLRLDDNPALAAASTRGAVLPVFVWAPERAGRFAPGSAGRWWLHHSLVELSENLSRAGSRLVIVRDSPESALRQIAEGARATAVFWNRLHDASGREEERRVTEALRAGGIHGEGFDGSLIFPPDSVRTGQGQPFKMFTPYWRACRALTSPPGPGPRPRTIDSPLSGPDSLDVRDLGLLPQPDRAAGIRSIFAPGEAGALRALEEFAAGPSKNYADERDRPAVRGTSRLSPHLHFGEISPRRVWHAVSERAPARKGATEAPGASEFLRQLGWREFAQHLLHHFPHAATGPLRDEFSRFPWRDDPNGLRAWRKGETGYPLVDAGMHELSATGWMHNRSRMVAASFLVKDLLVDWTVGAAWFWDALVDADLANNTLGWQWVTGCGADAAPFFRIFNPTLQGEKFDADGAYVRRWVPELGGLPRRWIHRPWEAPRDALEKAGVVLGKTYPRPIVDHRIARERAIAAFASIQKKR